MNYLFVCATFFDQGGFAMVEGAVNGIRQADPEAVFGAMLRPQGYAYRPGFFLFDYPREYDAGMDWADIVLDVGGITIQNAYRTRLMTGARQRKTPYVFMPQSCVQADPWLFEEAIYIARGERSARVYHAITGRQPDLIAPDLSFLVAPDAPDRPAPRRVFVTHLNKPFGPMRALANTLMDVQVQFKPPRDGKIWEPYLNSRLSVVTGDPARLFGWIGMAREVHTARYQAACGAILQGVPYTTYVPDTPKYEDLADMAREDPKILRAQAGAACEMAAAIGRKSEVGSRSEAGWS